MAIAFHTIKRQPYGSCQLPITVTKHDHLIQQFREKFTTGPITCASASFRPCGYKYLKYSHQTCSRGSSMVHYTVLCTYVLFWPGSTAAKCALTATSASSLKYARTQFFLQSRQNKRAAPTWSDRAAPWSHRATRPLTRSLVSPTLAPKLHRHCRPPLPQPLPPPSIDCRNSVRRHGHRSPHFIFELRSLWATWPFHCTSIDRVPGLW